MDLGLSDDAIASLRQQADVNSDGVVDWEEMVAILEPLLGKFHTAELECAPEYLRWCLLHWEAHRTVTKDAEGYSRCGKTFWVNKVTGQSSWTLPEVLKDHPEYLKVDPERIPLPSPLSSRGRSFLDGDLAV
jgi:hypothetical protein